MFKSTGKLHYESGYKLALTVDKDLAAYYRFFIPKYYDIQPPGYHPHITIVRGYKQIPPNIQYWNKYQGQEVEFAYNNIIDKESYYFWINAWSTDLEDIRRELGLPVYSRNSSPEGFNMNFHITIAVERTLFDRKKE